ncbi:hypothetical protein K6119_09775 [Paracrocinitomix mangrovi]|uniref:hypothetical protein n=1 Tax=Paracrocinitomix mangrovi TaxID=2862509 RepID=UPI001C8D7DC7|nr:hypothetical protein [Paracrocinitomix mangrovi]UKN03778.1 hypothetical protein K6119_09775 [Paracrocinitomix mangrovi]
MKLFLSFFALSLLLINCGSHNTATEGIEINNEVDFTNNNANAIEPGIQQETDKSPVIFHSSIIDSSVSFPIFVISSENPNSRVLKCYTDGESVHGQSDILISSPEIHFEISNYLNLKVDSEYLIPNDQMNLKITEMGILSNFWVVTDLKGSVIFREIKDSLMIVQFDLNGIWTNTHEPKKFEYFNEVIFDNYH